MLSGFLVFMVTILSFSRVLREVVQIGNAYVVTVQDYFERKKQGGYPSGQFPLPLVGSNLSLSKKPLNLLLSLRNTYGDITSIYLGSSPVIVVSNYNVVCSIIQQGRRIAKPNSCCQFKVVRKWNELGISSTEDDNNNESEIHRKFVMKRLTEIPFKVESAIIIEINKLTQYLASKKDESIDSVNLFNEAVTSSLWTLVSGHRFEQSDPTDSEFKSFIDAVSRHVHNLRRLPPVFLPPLLNKLFHGCTPGALKNENEGSALLIFKFVEKQVDNYIQDIKLYRASLEYKPSSLMKNYLEQMRKHEKQPLSEFYGDCGRSKMINTIKDLFLEGPESVSATLTWALLYLIMLPMEQRQIYDEIHSILGRCLPGLEHKQEMPRTRAFISEVLRCSSVVPLAPCHMTKADVSFHGYNIPRETIIIPNLHAVHRDESIWGPEAFTFNPNRFLTVTPGPNSSIVYNTEMERYVITMSAGEGTFVTEEFARHQLFLIVASLVQRFEFIMDPGFRLEQIVLQQDCDQTKFLLAPKPFKFRIRDRFNLRPEI